MEPDGNLLPSILILLLMILLRAFFIMSEISVISLNDNKIKAMARDSKKARILLNLIESPSNFLSTIRVGITFSGFIASAVAAESFVKYIVTAMHGAPFSSRAVHALAIAVLAVTLSYFILVLGELVPKRVAMNHYEKFAFIFASLISLCQKIGSPFVWLISASSNVVLRLMGIDPENVPEEVTEEEIRMLVDVGGERGSIEKSEKEMINNIFEFDDRTVDYMMTHRTEIVYVNLATPLHEIIGVALSSGRTRIPVCEDDLDTIVGILYVKDLLELIIGDENSPEFSLASYMREPLYVLESNTCMEVLIELKAKKIHLAIVADEYGGTAGLVTMEDLLESIVGNIQDEYDTDEEDEIFELGESRFLVDGLTSLEDVDKFFSLSLSEDEEFETIGGYVVNRLGRIPSDGEHPSIEAGDYRFIVSEMDERRVSKLEVERLNPQESLANTQ